VLLLALIIVPQLAAMHPYQPPVRSAEEYLSNPAEIDQDLDTCGQMTKWSQSSNLCRNIWRAKIAWYRTHPDQADKDISKFGCGPFGHYQSDDPPCQRAESADQEVHPLPGFPPDIGNESFTN
jgi:hypothetical protein